MKPATKIRKVAEQEFLGETFGQIDRRGLPLSEEALRENAADQSDPLAPDPRFAGLTDSGAVAARALKSFLNDLPEDVIRETGDADLVAEYKRNHSTTVVHVCGYEVAVRRQGDKWIGEVEIDGEPWTFDAKHRDDLLSLLAKTLGGRKDEVRGLTATEKLEVIRYAQMGLVQDAIGRYVYFAIGRREIDSAFEILDNPRYRPLCDAAVWFVWTHAKNDYAPTAEREEFIRQFVAGRPLTIALLDAAWQACQSAERDAAESLKSSITPDEPEPTQQDVARDLENLGDDEVRRLLGQTLRVYSREIRSGAR